MSVGSISLTNYFFPSPVLPTITNKQDFSELLKGKDFYRNQAELKSFFSKLSFEDQDEYLKEIARVSFTTNDQELLARCRSLLTREGVEAVLKKTHTNFVDLETSLQQRCMHFKYRPERTFNTSPTFFSDVKQDIAYLFNVLVSYINTLIQSFNLLDANKQPKSAWDASFQLQIYYQLFQIPIKLFSGLQTYITNPILLNASLLGLLLALYSYIKWLQPPPNELPKGINLSQLIQKPVIGRFAERQAFIHKLDLLSSHSTETRKHLWLHGVLEVGKNALLEGVAYEIRYNRTGRVPESLRRKKIVYFRASDFINYNSFDSSTPLENLEKAIGRYGESYIPVIDEADLLFTDAKTSVDMKIRMNNSVINPIRLMIFLSSKKPEDLNNPEIASRLYPFLLETMTEEQTLEVLEGSPTLSEWDLEFPREELRPLIKPGEEQPSSAKLNLFDALSQIRKNWKGESLLNELDALVNELATLTSKVSFHANGNSLNASTDLFNQISAKEKKIEMKTQELKVFQEAFQIFENMKKRGNALEAALPSLMNRIKKPNWRDRRRLEDLKLEFYITEFYLLEIKDPAIKEFAKKHKIMTSLKEAVPPMVQHPTLEFNKPIYVIA